MRVLLLNPPSPKKSKVKIIRDYYCSKTSKSSYLFAPIDLLMQSAVLSEGNELSVIDSIALEWDEIKTLREIQRIGPEFILGLISAVNEKNELEFYFRLKESFKNTKIFLSGETLLEEPEKWLEKNPYIDGVLLRFISPSLSFYLRGQDEKTFDLVYREDGEIISKPLSEGKEYSVGVSRQELFQFRRYFFPFARRKKFATFLTDFGCPFNCGFCVMGGLGYRKRNLEEIKEETNYLLKLNICELFLSDQCFGADKKHTEQVLEIFALAKIGFTTFTRPDLVTKELAGHLKSSGCHTLIMGVETADESLLKIYGKGYGLEEIEMGFRYAKEAGIETVATVIIGLPEDTKDSILNTMKFLKKLNPDFVSYNVAVPRQGTELRKNAIEKRLYNGGEFDQAGSFSVLKTFSLSSREIEELKKKAVRDFYVRPGYWLKKLYKLDSLYSFKVYLKEGLALLLKNL